MGTNVLSHAFFQFPLCNMYSMWFLLRFSYDGKARGAANSKRATVPKNKNSSNIKEKQMNELSSNTTDDLEHEWPFSDEEDEDGSDQSFDREKSILERW